MSNRRLLTAFAAVCLSASLALAGCSGSPAGSSPESGSSQPAAQGTGTSTAPSGEASATSGETAPTQGNETQAPGESEAPVKTSPATTKATSGGDKPGDSVLEQTDKYASDNLPKKDMNKFVLRVGTTDKTLLKNLTDEKDGAVNSLRYEKLAEIEKRFNCTIQPVLYEYGKAAERFSALILSGASGSVPHVLLSSAWEAGNLMAGNLLQDFGQLKHVDADAPWWNQSMAEASRIGGKTYLMLSELTRPSTRSWGVMYNKKIAKEIGLDEATLTTLVNNKQWTWDKFIEYAKKAVKDTNGDGKFTEKDRWGFASPRTDLTYALMAAGGADFIVNSGGKMTYGLNNDHAITVLEKMNAIVTKEGIRFPTENNTAQRQAAEDEQVLFYLYTYTGMMDMIEDLGDHGLLPMPIGPGQKDYYGLVDHNVEVITIPKTNKDLENTGILLEALSFADWKLLPDIVEEYTYTVFDEDDKLSPAVLSNIFDQAVVNPALYNDTTAFITACKRPILDAVATANSDISGTVAAIRNSTQAANDDFFNQ